MLVVLLISHICTDLFCIDKVEFWTNVAVCCGSIRRIPVTEANLDGPSRNAAAQYDLKTKEASEVLQTVRKVASTERE
jgi:hypothetical protein